MQSIVEKFSVILYLIVLISAPFCVGVFGKWAISVLEAGSFLALSFYSASRVSDDKTFYYIPGLIPISLFLCFILFQIVPLPPKIIRYLSPNAYASYGDAIGHVSEYGLFSLSLNPHSTLTLFFLFASYISIYIFTVQYIIIRKKQKSIVYAILVIMAFLSCIGVIQYVIFGDKVAWVLESKRVYSLFPYRNWYAGLLSMFIPVCLSLLIIDDKNVYRIKYGYVNKFKYIFLDETKKILFIIFFIICFAILFSASRGGVISLILSCTGLLTVIQITQRNNSSFFIVCVLVLLIIISVGYDAWELLDYRFGQLFFEKDGLSLSHRTYIWLVGFKIIKDYFLTGVGFGASFFVFQKYNLSYYLFRNPLNIHNEYMELLVDGGVIALIIFCLFIFMVLRRTIQGVRQERDRLSVSMCFGAIFGIVSFLIFSLDDSLLHGYLVTGVYFFFLLGLSVSAAYTRTDSNYKTSLRVINGKLQPVTISLVSFVFFVLSLWFNFGGLAADRILQHYPTVNDNTLSPAELEKRFTEAQRACRLTPLHANKYYVVAHYAELLHNDAIAESNYLQALRLNPVFSYYMWNYGLFLEKKGKTADAERLYKNAVLYDWRNPKYSVFYVTWLLKNERREDAVQFLRTALARDDFEKNKKILQQLFAANVILPDLSGVLPERTPIHLVYASLLAKQHNPSAASRAYVQAVSLLGHVKEVKKWFITRPYSFFMRQKQYDRAVMVARRGVHLFPGDLSMQFSLARALAAKGQLDEAEQLMHRTLQHLVRFGKAKPWHFRSLYALYQRQKKDDKAMATLQEATKTFPRDAGLHLTLGDYYRSRKMRDSALLEYQQANALKPGDKGIQRRLDAFKTAEEKIEEQVDALLRLQE